MEKNNMEKYFSFSNLATRSEYWAVLIITFFAGMFGGFIGAAIMGLGSNVALAFGAVLLLAVVVLGTWVAIATTVRRCRDAGINVWWTLAACVPYVGWIVAIVIGVLPTATNAE
jgi:uncharacterized membrane protein YhaH (DUF805 family)